MIIDGGIIAVFVSLILAVVGISFGYGILTNKVSSARYDIQEIKKKYDDIDGKLDDLCILVKKIETLLNGR